MENSSYPSQLFVCLSVSAFPTAGGLYTASAKLVSCGYLVHQFAADSFCFRCLPDIALLSAGSLAG